MALTLGGIIGACGLFCGFLSWVLMEQMRYLSEQIRKRAARKKKQKNVFQDEQ